MDYEKMYKEALEEFVDIQGYEEYYKINQDAGSGLVLDIPQLVEKINEIIRYINEKEEENEHD